VSLTLRARFGQRVRKLRKARKWTQEEMAARFGLDRAYVSHVERGTKNICLPTLDILAKGFQYQPCPPALWHLVPEVQSIKAVGGKAWPKISL